MIQDSINTLAEIQNLFKNSYSIEVRPDGTINLFHQEDLESDETSLQEFKNSQDMIEWMEGNLIRK